jgi:hypothetical protein
MKVSEEFLVAHRASSLSSIGLGTFLQTKRLSQYSENWFALKKSKTFVVVMSAVNWWKSSKNERLPAYSLTPVQWNSERFIGKTGTLAL